MTEADLRKTVIAGLSGENVHVQRIELDTNYPGPFDLNCCWAGIEWWIELKVGRSPLRKEQKGWGMRRLAHGGRLWLMNWSLDTMELWHARAVIEHGYDAELQTWHAPINWFQVRQAMTK